MLMDMRRTATAGIASRLLALSAAALLVSGTCEPGGSVRPAQRPRANGLIAFVREGRIYSLDPRTGDTAALTTNLDAEGLTWSPNGDQLAFLTEVTGPAIRVMRPDGERMRTLMDAGPTAPKLIFGFSRPTWSPDGTQLAFGAAHLSTQGICKGEPTDPPVLEPPWWCTQSHLFILDIRSGAIRQLTDGVVLDLDPAWSPDGSKIAFVRIDWRKAASGKEGDPELLFVDPEGGTPQRLSSRAAFYGGELAWSPDGSKLLFQDDAGHVSVMDVTAFRITQLVTDTTTQTELRHPAWSPDGKSILFTRQRDGTESVFLVDVEGGPERALIQGCCAAWQPATPQGSRPPE